MEEGDVKQQVAIKDAIQARIKSCPYYCDGECYAVAESGLPFTPVVCANESCAYIGVFLNKLTDQQEV